jgi:cytochrome c553
MSAVTDRLSEDDFRELARIIRAAHARRAARLERERAERDRGDEPRAGDGDHVAT